MNKLELLKTFFDNKEVVRHLNYYQSDDKLKKKIMQQMKKQNIPLSEIKEDNQKFTIGNNVIFKNANAKITIGNIQVKSNKIIFDKCEINLTSIKEINEKEFKTDYATYYIGGF